MFVLSNVIVPSSMISLETLSKSNRRRRFLLPCWNPKTSRSYNDEVKVNLPNGTSNEASDFVNHVGSANHSSGAYVCWLSLKICWNKPKC